MFSFGFQQDLILPPVQTWLPLIDQVIPHVFRSCCHLLAFEISEFHPHTSTISESAKVAPPILAKPFLNLL
jgi:hypothetical protein